MKRILITGADSYIGTSVEKWLKRSEFSGMYQVDTVDMRGERWKNKDFSGYDTVFHVAGIAHQKETKENETLYYKINCNLAIEAAVKARDNGVKQFIFLSSMSVYGVSEGMIDKKTVPHPQTHYGKSKYQAEKKLVQLSCEKFQIAIVRPPMVYGKGCKGNYQLLRKAALYSPVFPDIKNKRSMIYVDNLAEYIRHLIENRSEGIFLPQNSQYTCTSEMVKMIAHFNGKKLCLTNIFNWGIKCVMGNKTVKKVFGSLYYDTEGELSCSMIPWKETIRETEK